MTWITVHHRLIPNLYSPCTYIYVIDVKLSKKKKMNSQQYRKKKRCKVTAKNSRTELNKNAFACTVTLHWHNVGFFSVLTFFCLKQHITYIYTKICCFSNIVLLRISLCACTPAGQTCTVCSSLTVNPLKAQ